MALSEAVSHKPLRELRPDPKNPRLLEDVRGTVRGDDLIVHLADAFDAITVAESIARHGYFGSEPLVVTAEDGACIVLEGNRRLAALLGLARPDLRERFEEHERWDQAAARQEISLDMDVPILVADRREDADALIGFRHIAGVSEWKPLQRAQFIAHLVDERGQDFVEVADTVGEEESVVRMLYRNQGILKGVRDFGRSDLARTAENRFGIYTAALNRNGLRDFIGARPVPDVRERQAQLSERNLPHFLELSSFLYGDEENPKVISESRELSMLAEVIRVPAALDELRRTRKLYSAYGLTSGPPKRLMKQLALAVGHLRAVVGSVDLIARQDRAHELADELERLVADLRDGLGRNGSGADGPPEA